MAYYYKISDGETVAAPPLEGIQVFDENSADCSGPCIKYDFSKHVLIELLDNVTPETKIWTELGLSNAKTIAHKRMIVDPHRVNCRRAIVVCSSSEEAKELAQRLSQAKIMRRSICAVVIQELLSDICLFEKQIIQYGDKRSQHQLVYVTELTRCREPSGLAQYLREKFSPFGTILSVLVSEDQDGYAYPEGVIKFAHLSEAFAAELAYDQCAVALERLSVTTHHNILLSQCDLRARLREAYTRQSSEFSFNAVSSESQVKDGPFVEADSDLTKIIPSSNSKCSVKESENHEQALNESGSTMDGNNAFPSDSAEIADIMKKPCESNLIDCLQGIAACSESSVSRRASGSSLPETEPGSTEQSTLPLNNSLSSPLDKTWSSRIVGWITDLPTLDPSSHVDAPQLESTILIDKDKNLGCNQQSKPTSPKDVVSSASSFVTCTNGELNSSFHSILTSLDGVSDSNNVTVVEDKTFSQGSECNPSEMSDGETSNPNGSIWESTAVKSNGSPVLSLKRRNTSIVTEKLSLKSKRLNLSQPHSVGEVLSNDTTVLLPSVPKTRSCSVVLNSVPELDEFAKNLSAEKLSVFPLERLSSSSIDGTLKIDGANLLSITEIKAKVKKFSKKEIKNSPSSVKSQPVRRSSRLTTHGSDKRACSQSMRSGTKPSTSADFVDSEKKSLSETESPLRMWLRKELDSSTNNLVTRSKESAKSIVCATTNKDVLISVGCSHMTCDFCYPDSTKLLLGFH